MAVNSGSKALQKSGRNTLPSHVTKVILSQISLSNITLIFVGKWLESGKFPSRKQSCSLPTQSVDLTETDSRHLQSANLCKISFEHETLTKSTGI